MIKLCVSLFFAPVEIWTSPVLLFVLFTCMLCQLDKYTCFTLILLVFNLLLDLCWCERIGFLLLVVCCILNCLKLSWYPWLEVWLDVAFDLACKCYMCRLIMIQPRRKDVPKLPKVSKNCTLLRLIKHLVWKKIYNEGICNVFYAGLHVALEQVLWEQQFHLSTRRKPNLAICLDRCTVPWRIQRPLTC